MEENKSSHTKDSDEINLLEYFYVLVKNKWVIIFLTVIGFAGGMIAARIIGPVYVSDSVIAPKENDSKASPNLSGLGMFGGAVASQLNMGGDASLKKIEMFLDSRTFLAGFIDRYDLKPLLLPEKWDTLKSDWVEDYKVPQSVKVVGRIKGDMTIENEQDIMNIKYEHADSLTADTVLASLLSYIDHYVRQDVKESAEENREYLEKKLITIEDPLLRGKIQELIASEVEKEMVVSKEAFKVVDKVLTKKDFSIKKLYPLVFAAGLFFMAVMAVIILHAFSSSEKTEEDIAYIERIKKDLIKLPWQKPGV